MYVLWLNFIPFSIFPKYIFRKFQGNEQKIELKRFIELMYI